MPGVFKTDIWFLAANPERGLICISKFFGIDTAKPVGIIAVLPGSISYFFQYLRQDPYQKIHQFRIWKEIFLDNLLINISVIN